MTTRVVLEPDDSQRLAALCGPFDQNLKHLEKRLGVLIRNRGNVFQVSGPEPQVIQAARLLHRLYRETGESAGPDPGVRSSASAGVRAGGGNGDGGAGRQRWTRAAGRPRRSQPDSHPAQDHQARGPNQLGYVSAIRDHDINFGIGPAGTGKTFLAVASAVEALVNESRVQRILLVRPAVEAGEKLGFLPGDLSQKVDPYLRPLYDALYEMLGVDNVLKLIERNVIEIAPLAYMRGRTLNDAWVILDESQNTTIEQMKMFLTRIGFGSTAVITGDVTQTDLPKHQSSGLRDAVEVLRGVDGISFTFFTARDVVRHPLVQKIVEAYAAFQEPSAGADGDRNAG
jgi:phosphate starvation-inducible protein PhoH and related proteins